MKYRLTAFIIIVIACLLSYIPIQAQGLAPCEPCPLNNIEIGDYTWSDNVNGCTFKIKYEKHTNQCNGRWDIKILDVELLTPCSVYTVEQIVAMGIMFLIQDNPMMFPLTNNGSPSQIRVMGPTCWRLSPAPPTGGNSKIIGCTPFEACCLYYSYNHMTDCQDNGVVFEDSNNKKFQCQTSEPLMQCKNVCDDVWKILFWGN